MASDAGKKRKPKVIRTDGATPEGKRGKAEGEQVTAGPSPGPHRAGPCWRPQGEARALHKAPGGLAASSPPPQDARYYSEECEVDLRDPIKDYELYKETCQELQRLMAEIQELKSRGIKDNVREASGGWLDALCSLMFSFNLGGSGAGLRSGEK